MEYRRKGKYIRRMNDGIGFYGVGIFIGECRRGRWNVAGDGAEGEKRLDSACLPSWGLRSGRQARHDASIDSAMCDEEGTVDLIADKFRDLLFIVDTGKKGAIPVFVIRVIND